MDNELERFAAALGVAAPSPAEEEALLVCAREVAHATQRRHAPLSTFLLGVAVGASDVDRETALTAAVSRVLAVVQAADTPTDPPQH